MSVFKPANILVPKTSNFKSWSVVACDQHTSEPEYWNDVEKEVGTNASTLRIIFPEVFLGGDNSDKRIKEINGTMSAYLNELDVFAELENSLIYVERKLSSGKIRRGIVGVVDLEEYDFNKGSQSKIRATEGTVLERIPPRLRVRENAPLEASHIMMLIDDKNKTVIEPLDSEKGGFDKIYDFDLMLDGGHLCGYRITDDAAESVLGAIDKLSDINEFHEKYGSDKEPLVIAVGDGNHSLATAKINWENIKENLKNETAECSEVLEALKKHPARYALVELENIHDDALEFEPIQRVVFDVDPEKLLDDFIAFYDGASYSQNGGQEIRYTYGEKSGAVYVKDAPSNLPIGTLQIFLDDYLKKNGGSVDYIHGEDVVKKLSAEKNTIGFMVDAMEKGDLFDTVIKDGSLPRKTFSMGNPEDKRYYFEFRRIK